MSKRTCSIEDCERPNCARSLCQKHYDAWKRGTLSIDAQLDPIPSLWDRFWSKVDASGDCWEWTGAGKRYGRFTMPDGELALAHRVSWEWLVGPIPEGYTIDHLCRNIICVNPDHLEPVTLRENLLRAHATFQSKNARKTHCKWGHPFNEENTFERPGGRGCRQCRRDQAAKRSAS